MLDLYIFGFGLVVTLIVGSGLVFMVLTKNREVDVADASAEDGVRLPAAAPVVDPQADSLRRG